MQKQMYKFFNLSLWTLLVLIGVFIVLPQLNNQEYIFSTITSKLIFFLFGIIILAGFYTYRLINSKTIVFSITKLDLSLLVLLLYITVNRYFLQPYFGFSIRHIELLGLTLLYVVLRRVSLNYYPWLLLAIVVSGIIQVAYGNLQLLGYYSSNHSGFKMTGSFFNTGPYAGFLVSVWTIALGMYLFRDYIIVQLQSQLNSKIMIVNRLIRYTLDYIPLLGLISIATILPTTQSRAAWLAAIVGSIFLVQLRYRFFSNWFKKRTTALQKTILPIFVLGILCVTLIGLYNFKKESADGRSFIWKITTKMITDHPLLGVGFDRFTAHYMEYQADYFVVNGETSEALLADNVNYAFNEPLQFVAENGFFGFIILLIILFILTSIKAKDNHQSLISIAKTSLITIAIFSCFSYPMQILPIKIVLVTALALLAHFDSNVYERKISVNNAIPSGYKKVFISLCLIGIIIASLEIYNLGKGFKSWKIATDPIVDYETALNEFETAYPIFNNHGDFLMSYGKTLSLAEKNKQAITILQRAEKQMNTTITQTALGDAYKGTKQYKKAEIAYKKAYSMSPSRFYPLYLLAKLYDESNDKKKAIKIAQNILNKKVKIPSTAINEIQEEMKHILVKYKSIKN